MAREILTEFDANTRPWEKSVDRIDRRLGRLNQTVNNRLTRFDARMEKSARAVRGLGAAFGLALGADAVGRVGREALRVAGDFEAAMNRVRAAGRLGEEAQAALAKRARELGASTQFTASEAASAIETLIKNGVGVEDILNGALEASLKASAALGGPLAASADLVTDAMLQFGKDASELGGVVDTLAGVAVNSKFGFDDLRLALAQGGGVAGAAGVQFEDFAASLAATAANFASGSDAGTSFKTFVTSLTGNSKNARAAINDLGLEFFDAEGNLRSMSEIAQELNEGLADLSEEARTAALKDIFGNDAFRTAAGLAEAAADGVDRLSASIAGVDSGEIASARMEGFNGAVRRLNSAWEELLLSLSDDGGLETATNAVAGLTEALVVLPKYLDEAAAAVLAVASARVLGALSAAWFRNRDAMRAAEKAAVSLAAKAKEDVSIFAARADAANRAERGIRRSFEETGRGAEKMRKATEHAERSRVALADATRAYTARVRALEHAKAAATVSVANFGRVVGGAAQTVSRFLGGPLGMAFLAYTLMPEFTSATEDAQLGVENLGRALSEVEGVDRRIISAKNSLADANRLLGESETETARLAVNAANKRLEALEAERKARLIAARATLAELTQSAGEFAADDVSKVIAVAVRRAKSEPVLQALLAGNPTPDQIVGRIGDRQDADKPLLDEELQLLDIIGRRKKLENDIAAARERINALSDPIAGVGPPSLPPAEPQPPSAKSSPGSLPRLPSEDDAPPVPSVGGFDFARELARLSRERADAEEDARLAISAAEGLYGEAVSTRRSALDVERQRVALERAARDEQERALRAGATQEQARVLGRLARERLEFLQEEEKRTGFLAIADQERLSAQKSVRAEKQETSSEDAEADLGRKRRLENEAVAIEDAMRRRVRAEEDLAIARDEALEKGARGVELARTETEIRREMLEIERARADAEAAARSAGFSDATVMQLARDAEATAVAAAASRQESERVSRFKDIREAAADAAKADTAAFDDRFGLMLREGLEALSVEDEIAKRREKSANDAIAAEKELAASRAKGMSEFVRGLAFAGDRSEFLRQSLGKIADQLLDSAFQEIFKGVLGGGSGGFFGSLTSGLGSALSSGIGALFGFADGGVMSAAGAVPLRRYAGGGIAASPQLALFGEGAMNEAYVPLPDGRSIPVTLSMPRLPDLRPAQAVTQIDARSYVTVERATGDERQRLQRDLDARDAKLRGVILGDVARRNRHDPEYLGGF